MSTRTIRLYIAATQLMMALYPASALGASQPQPGKEFGLQPGAAPSAKPDKSLEKILRNQLNGQLNGQNNAQKEKQAAAALANAERARAAQQKAIDEARAALESEAAKIDQEANKIAAEAQEDAAKIQNWIAGLEDRAVDTLIPKQKKGDPQPGLVKLTAFKNDVYVIDSRGQAVVHAKARAAIELITTAHGEEKPVDRSVKKNAKTEPGQLPDLTGVITAVQTVENLRTERSATVKQSVDLSVGAYGKVLDAEDEGKTRDDIFKRDTASVVPKHSDVTARTVWTLLLRPNDDVVSKVSDVKGAIGAALTKEGPGTALAQNTGVKALQGAFPAVKKALEEMNNPDKVVSLPKVFTEAKLFTGDTDPTNKSLNTILGANLLAEGRAKTVKFDPKAKDTGAYHRMTPPLRYAPLFYLLRSGEAFAGNAAHLQGLENALEFKEDFGSEQKLQLLYKKSLVDYAEAADKAKKFLTSDAEAFKKIAADYNENRAQVAKLRAQAQQKREQARSIADAAPVQDPAANRSDGGDNQPEPSPSPETTPEVAKNDGAGDGDGDGGKGNRGKVEMPEAGQAAQFNPLQPAPVPGDAEIPTELGARPVDTTLSGGVPVTGEGIQIPQGGFERQSRGPVDPREVNKFTPGNAARGLASLGDSSAAALISNPTGADAGAGAAGAGAAGGFGGAGGGKPGDSGGDGSIMNGVGYDANGNDPGRSKTSLRDPDSQGQGSDGSGTPLPSNDSPISSAIAAAMKGADSVIRIAKATLKGPSAPRVAGIMGHVSTFGESCFRKDAEANYALCSRVSKDFSEYIAKSGSGTAAGVTAAAPGVALGDTIRGISEARGNESVPL